MSKIKVSEVKLQSNEDGEPMCLEQLQREAFKCLDTFPGKVKDLNEILEKFTPTSPKKETLTRSKARRFGKSQSSPSSRKALDSAVTPDADGNLRHSQPEDVSRYYSMTAHDRSRLRHGICKRRYYRMQTINGSTLRRRPSPLGQLLAFIAGRLAVCTRKIIIAPSYYIIDRIISMFIQRRQVKNAQCETSPSLTSSFSCYMITLKEDNSTVGNFIRTMRPAAVQLIADTTILKRWLQALALTSNGRLSDELTNATRTTETIDGWAYELFFHLKYLQVNRAQQATDEAPAPTEDASRAIELFFKSLFKATASGVPKTSDDTTQAVLWQRLTQLRDHYITLYESLYSDRKIDSRAP